MVGGFSAYEWLMLLERELLLFAGVAFLVGSTDEICMDIAWLWLRLTGCGKARVLPADDGGGASTHGQTTPLAGPAAIFVPAWMEAAVIGTTISHMMSVWPQPNLRLYVGCYGNDPETIQVAIKVCGLDPRIRLVIHDRMGPTTKGDCLNRLYKALLLDEEHSGCPVRMVVLHDAEDMVDPAGLRLLDAAIEDAVLAQLPVLPEPQPRSRWVGSHYCEEFAEAHGKAMVVRDALGAGMPLAGVGCAIARDALTRLAQTRRHGEPFAADALTEDYELGLGVSALGGKTRFLRYRHADGRLVATRAYFPAGLDEAVRQKTRWIHGIAFQGWDRLGWDGRPAELWMRLRDRRGPLTALVLALAYILLLMTGVGYLLQVAGLIQGHDLTSVLRIVLALNLLSFIWRAVWRYAFTAHEYGWREGLRSVMRLPVANFIAILAGRRALTAYALSLAGRMPKWDKTHHHAHPAQLLSRSAGQTSAVQQTA